MKRFSINILSLFFLLALPSILNAEPLLCSEGSEFRSEFFSDAQTTLSEIVYFEGKRGKANKIEFLVENDLADRRNFIKSIQRYEGEKSQGWRISYDDEKKFEPEYFADSLIGTLRGGLLSGLDESSRLQVILNSHLNDFKNDILFIQRIENTETPGWLIDYCDTEKMQISIGLPMNTRDILEGRESSRSDWMQ